MNTLKLLISTWSSIPLMTVCFMIGNAWEVFQQPTADDRIFFSGGRQKLHPLGNSGGGCCWRIIVLPIWVVIWNQDHFSPSQFFVYKFHSYISSFCYSHKSQKCIICMMGLPQPKRKHTSFNLYSPTHHAVCTCKVFIHADFVSPRVCICLSSHHDYHHRFHHHSYMLGWEHIL